VVAVVTMAAPRLASAQPGPKVESEVAAPRDTVDVSPKARDEEIDARLENIMRATSWFADLDVRVQDGVVFLAGVVDTDEHRLWAAELARRTQDVAAVVNQLAVPTPSVFELEPATRALRELGRGVVGALPLLMFAILVLAVAWLMSRLTTGGMRRLLQRRALPPLLREVLARVSGVAVMIVGLYIVFRVAGLTTVAMSVVGGTGLIGIVLGIAFREISENFLASVFLSLQPPFRPGDLLDIDEHTGFVDRLTTRATVLISLEGNHIQIPNSKVYRATIRNYTSNPNRREVFTVGIGYDDAISDAQDVAMGVLRSHPAVLTEPEPWVLVDSLGAATVNLRIYFWLDGTTHSWLKVRSSVIRLVKRAFQASGISMPDEARELVFPQGVPVHLTNDGEAAVSAAAPVQRPPRAPETETADITTSAEGGLSSEADQLRDQSRNSRAPEKGDDLLLKSSGTRPAAASESSR